jgi:hypothetical protein
LVPGNGLGIFLIEASGCANSGVRDCHQRHHSMESDQSEPLDSFSRFRLSVALRSVAYIQRTAQSVFGSALDARIWKGNRSGGCGENNTLIDPDAVTKRDGQTDLSPVLTEFRRRWSGVGLFAHPVKINLLVNEQRMDSPVDAALNKNTRKLRAVQTRLKNLVHASFNVKTVSRQRPEVNLLARIHCWLVSKLRLPHTTDGRSNKNRIRNRHLATAGSEAQRQSGPHHRPRKARAEKQTFLCSR